MAWPRRSFLGTHLGTSGATKREETGGKKGNQMEEAEERERHGERGGEETDTGNSGSVGSERAEEDVEVLVCGAPKFFSPVFLHDASC